MPSVSMPGTASRSRRPLWTPCRCWTRAVDPATEDLLIEQLRDLEQFQWFVRAHLENAGGTLATSGARTEQEAARRGESAG
nr:hypothetical protein StreXyl84_79220 [Streptomyces sp. Xyl84]